MVVTGSSARSLVGRQLGRFRIVERVASGGMATVYLAKRVGAAGFERTVAIKVLHEHLCSDDDFVAMFLDEARLTAALDHPHVVDVYDVDRIEGELVLVMRYIEGCALSGLLKAAKKRGHPLDSGVALQVVHDMLLGLHHAHELRDPSGEPMGVIHRDVSPQNVLVGTDGIARVADFGIAKARGRLVTTEGSDIVKGKWRYLAPEQARGKPLDRRTDIFAAGIVLWESLVGRPLFAAEHEAEIITRLLSSKIESPARERPDVPQDVSDACMRALSRDPDERFQTAEDMAEALSADLFAARVKRRDIGDRVYALRKGHIDRIREVASAPLGDDSTPRPSVTSAIASLGDPVSGKSEVDAPSTVTAAIVDPTASGKGRVRISVAAGVAVALFAGGVSLGLMSETRSDAVDVGAPPIVTEDPSAQVSAPAIASSQPADPTPAASPSATASSTASKPVRRPAVRRRAASPPPPAPAPPPPPPAATSGPFIPPGL